MTSAQIAFISQQALNASNNPLLYTLSSSASSMEFSLWSTSPFVRGTSDAYIDIINCRDISGTSLCCWILWSKHIVLVTSWDPFSWVSYIVFHSRLQISESTHEITLKLQYSNNIYIHFMLFHLHSDLLWESEFETTSPENYCMKYEWYRFI